MLCGIDCGVSGAIAWFSDEGPLIDIQDMPTVAVMVGKTTRNRLVPAQLADMLRQPGRQPTAAYVEQVQPMPKNGSIAGFGLGHAFGQIEGVLATLGVTIHLIPSKSWKRHWGAPLASMTDAQRKEWARQRELQLWPGLAASMARKKDHGRAEAALIGAYGISWYLGRAA